MSPLLYYHKCNDCLTAFTCDVKKVDMCDCGGSCVLMGQVHGTDYVKTEDKAPCDGRCTHAAGPVCDCQCGGVNHGTGKVVQTVVDQGKVKAVGLSEEDIHRAAIWRKLRDFAQNIVETRWSDTSFSTQEGVNAWKLKVKASAELSKIKKMKIYDKRHAAIATFINTYRVQA